MVETRKVRLHPPPSAGSSPEAPEVEGLCAGTESVKCN